ncbi:MAG: hypothetical protein KGL39_52075 [Patescibacteria group bacterium]|nr:hypothetical protein [Patescibacteria group bacterium]
MPRFDMMRGFITSQAANLEVRMQDSDDNSIAERPWTAQNLSYAKKQVHNRLKDSTKVFTVEKVGRPYGRNVVLDELVQGTHRRVMHGNGREGLQGEGERFFAGDQRNAADEASDGVRGADRGIDRYGNAKYNARLDGDLTAQRTGQARRGQGLPSDEAPWFNAVGDTDLAVQKYSQSTTGRAVIGPDATGGGRASNTREDQDRQDGEVARSTARQTLGATMAVAAKYGKMSRAGRQDTDYGQSVQAQPLGKSAAQKDVAVAYRSQQAGLVNVHLANTEAIAKGLREGTASAKRKIANQIIAAGARDVALSEGSQPAGRTPVPSGDPARVQKATEMPMATASAAQGLEVQSYRGAVPQQANPMTYGRMDAPFGSQSIRPSLGKSGVPEFISHTQDQTELGTTDPFGSQGTNEYRALSGVKTVAVRARQADEDITMRDAQGGMGEVF